MKNHLKNLLKNTVELITTKKKPIKSTEVVIEPRTNSGTKLNTVRQRSKSQFENSATETSQGLPKKASLPGNLNSNRNTKRIDELENPFSVTRQAVKESDKVPKGGCFAYNPIKKACEKMCSRGASEMLPKGASFGIGLSFMSFTTVQTKELRDYMNATAIEDSCNKLLKKLKNPSIFTRLCNDKLYKKSKRNRNRILAFRKYVKQIKDKGSRDTFSNKLVEFIRLTGGGTTEVTVALHDLNRFSKEFEFLSQSTDSKDELCDQLDKLFNNNTDYKSILEAFNRKLTEYESCETLNNLPLEMHDSLEPTIPNNEIIPVREPGSSSQEGVSLVASSPMELDFTSWLLFFVKLFF